MSDSTDVGRTAEAALVAAAELKSMPRWDRAAMLHHIADAIAEDSEALVEIAHRESHIPHGLLEAEVLRTVNQLRFFGEVLRDGSYLELTIDTDRGSAVHRMLQPLGVVGVFGSSNFPFAYGVAGGDTASALAAGCAVIVKEHPSHPETCREILARMKEGLRRAGANEDSMSLVTGFEAGRELVAHPIVQAVGFTGSVAGGRALFDIASSRPDPIPFYGELGSLNPIIVTEGAARERGVDLTTLVSDSMTARSGQMCTKPGLMLIPAGDTGDHLLTEMATRLRTKQPARLLNDSVRSGFDSGIRDLAAHTAVEFLTGEESEEPEVAPVLLEAPIGSVSAEDDLWEIFGPVALVLRYRTTTEIAALLADSEPSLVVGIHALESESELVTQLTEVLSTKVGRVVWREPTTGLQVGWATHHGGPYPASTSVLHTSVGATAIRRWLRPIAYQAFPAQFLPEEFTMTGPHAAPRRVNGEMTYPNTMEEE